MKNITIDGYQLTSHELKALTKAQIRKLRLTHKMQFTPQGPALTVLDAVQQAAQKATRRQARVQNEKRKRRRSLIKRWLKWQDKNDIINT
ncbi:hypothetical protein [Aeromonas sp.]|uniref:hypothetical protein n=1 Tax=Aeromonas sp. TaxID=647 RepID=UPI0025842E5D|nr:hypothetical protein [Aeromonas sp.]MCX7128044.1 hypothetical protein [Aeromonas sp.]